MEPSKQRPQPFVLLFEGRSGSTFLIETLQAHSEVAAEKEYLAALRSKNKTGADQITWARQFLDSDRPSRVRAVGFKTKLRDVLDPTPFGDLLREVRARVILLRRRNRVKHVVSLHNAIRLAEQTGDWNLYNNEHRLPADAIDPETFDVWLNRGRERLRHLEAYVGGLGLSTLDLYYEDFLIARRQTFQRVTDFLGIGFENVTGSAMKNTSDDLREAVVNFDELRARYSGSCYEWMFDEVLIHSGNRRQDTEQ